MKPCLIMLTFISAIVRVLVNHLCLIGPCMCLTQMLTCDTIKRFRSTLVQGHGANYTEEDFSLEE